MNHPSPTSERPPRLASLDALRGLDMLVILGLDALILLLASRAPDNGLLNTAAIQMTHAGWQGLRLYDLVFPVFVFIAGVSMSFSLARHADGKTATGPVLLKIWKRAFLLVLLGMLVNGPLTWTENMRYASVLGLIGLSCAIGGTCVLLLRRRGAIAAAAGGILALVALLQFSGGDFTPSGSVNSWLDAHILPGSLHDGTFDPEGPLCIISAAALCLGGWLTGSFLQDGRVPPVRRVLLMLAAGGCLFGMAWGLDGIYPVIKKMWTGTFVLAAAGVSLILLASFHLVIDVWKFRLWAFPLRIIGLNALAAYLIYQLLNIHPLNQRIFSGAADLFPPFQSVFLAVTLLLLQWLILFFFYKRNIFIKL